MRKVIPYGPHLFKYIKVNLYYTSPNYLRMDRPKFRWVKWLWDARERNPKELWDILIQDDELLEVQEDELTKPIIAAAPKHFRGVAPKASALELA